MTTQTQLMYEHAEYVFNRIDRTLNGLEDKHLNWKPTEVSNNIDWLLNHMCRIASITLPRIITGNQEYTQAGWPENYREMSKSLDEYKADLLSAKEVILPSFEGLTDDDLEKEIPLWRGRMVKRKTALFTYIGELVHHNGQIAYLKGTMTRLAEKDPNFL